MRRWPPILLALTAAATLAVVWWSRQPAPSLEEMGWPGDGLWRLGAPIEGDAEELARLLSLPYAAGSQLALAPGLGVVEYDRQRTQPGVNLYVSGHASEALLMNLQGVLLHRWQVDFRDAFPGIDKRPQQEQTRYLRRAKLLPDGDLLVLWQANGLARIDLRSRVEWSLDLGTYNDLFYADSRGGPTLITIGKMAERHPEVDSKQVLNDHLVWVDPESGAILRRLSLLDALLASPWSSALERRPHHADILHANTVTVLDESMVEGSRFQPGQVLFSLREISLLGVIDPQSESIIWALQGPPFQLQHEPVLLPGGRLLLFDNQGFEAEGGDGARAIEMTLDGEILWSYPDRETPPPSGDEAPVYSPKMGTVQRLANGNTLVVASESGRALEVTPDGDIVWRFETPHRTGDGGRFIAALPQLERLPAPAWLPASRQGAKPSPASDDEAPTTTNH